ncbi:MAG TPA: hypothetical protein VKL21_10710 [Candidatus Methanoperedens sp.]|nr:hypothetical protein [Candidatus Methanoperedens sp.]
MKINGRKEEKIYVMSFGTIALKNHVILLVQESLKLKRGGHDLRTVSWRGT